MSGEIITWNWPKIAINFYLLISYITSDQLSKESVDQFDVS